MMFTIAAFYRFVALPDPAVLLADPATATAVDPAAVDAEAAAVRPSPEALRDELRAAFTEDELCGTMLIAPEGINGTLAGSAEVIERLLALLAERVGLERAEVKFAVSAERPFGRLKFLVKREIIAFRKAVVDPTQVGRYVAPEEWNRLIADPEVLVLDTRNHYETELGTFAGAVDPGIETFSEFVTYVRENLDPEKHQKVAMYCTGGIRCEKASAFLLQEGFGEVFHLKGGILRYLEEVPEQESAWQGNCFVFDRRVAVGHGDFEG